MIQKILLKSAAQKAQERAAVALNSNQQAAVIASILDKTDKAMTTMGLSTGVEVQTIQFAVVYNGGTWTQDMATLLQQVVDEAISSQPTV